MPKAISAARAAKKAERDFFKQRAKAERLAKRREAREQKPERAREGQGSEQRLRFRKPTLPVRLTRISHRV